jgi:hypothetical protein
MSQIGGIVFMVGIPIAIFISIIIIRWMEDKFHKREQTSRK